jgi:hypothetical protein
MTNKLRDEERVDWEKEAREAFGEVWCICGDAVDGTEVIKRFTKALSAAYEAGVKSNKKGE